MFLSIIDIPAARSGFRPLAGCGLFPSAGVNKMLTGVVSVPLRGVGCFFGTTRNLPFIWFPSPCGVWVVSDTSNAIVRKLLFPSPCGVWVVSQRGRNGMRTGRFRPLAGCGLFLKSTVTLKATAGFRPLAGCGLFRGITWKRKN